MILLAERVTAEFRIAGNASLVRAGFAYDGVILASVRQACTIGFLLSGESEAAGDAAGGGAQPVPLIAGTCEAGGRRPASRGPAWVRRVTSLRPGCGIQVRAAVVRASRTECDLDAPPVVVKLARRKRQLVDSRDHRISFAPNQELI
ncbi:hypothetical protein BCEP4_710064 [Burkholderia cepacia]|nr:hypothetical protein BCEP4_710064 [Burkholderia cepacia]